MQTRLTLCPGERGDTHAKKHHTVMRVTTIDRGGARMPITVDEVYRQALTLPDDSKVSLTERLVAYMETHIEPEIERAHLDEARRRRDEVRTGQVVPLDGESVMSKARELVGR